MPLVTSEKMLLDAKKGGYAVGAFNVENMEMVKAVIAAAEELNAPVMLQTTPSTVKYGTLETFAGIVKAEAAKTKIPVCLHLDHGNSFELAVQAMKAGYTSVMIDGSHEDFENNIAVTKKVVDVANAFGIPVEAELEAVRNGENPELTTRQKHTRECFVVAEEGADLAQIENDIKTMPNYFSDYDTTVHFISEEELKRDHSGIPHGGFVIRSGKTGWNDENNHVIEYSLKLDSNPEFTSSVLVAYARAAYRMNKEGQSGAKTVFDVAPAYLCAADGAELRKHLL